MLQIYVGRNSEIVNDWQFISFPLCFSVTYILRSIESRLNSVYKSMHDAFHGKCRTNLIAKMQNTNTNFIEIKILFAEEVFSWIELKKWGRQFGMIADFLLASGLPCKGDDSCCTSSRPCFSGEGDCDWDSDCGADLVCGSNNCYKGPGSTFDSTDDCCVPEYMDIWEDLDTMFAKLIRNFTWTSLDLIWL